MSSPLTNILKMLFSGGLTRTGVDYGGAAPPSDQPGMISEGNNSGGSNQRFFHDPSEAGVALAQGMHPAAQVSTANLPDQLDSTADPTFSSRTNAATAAHLPAIISECRNRRSRKR